MAVTKNEIEDLKRYWFAGPKDWKLILRGAVLVLLFGGLSENLFPNIPAIVTVTLVFLIVMVYLTQHGLGKGIPERTIHNSNISLIFIITALGYIVMLYDNSFSISLLVRGVVSSVVWGKIATWLGVKIWNKRRKHGGNNLKMGSKLSLRTHESAGRSIFWQFIQELVGGFTLALAFTLFISMILAPAKVSINPIIASFFSLSIGLAGVSVLPSTTVLFEQRFGIRLNKWMKIILYFLFWALAVIISEVFPDAV